MIEDIRIQAALIAAIVGMIGGIIGSFIKHFLDKKLLRHKLETEYEYEERKKLRALIGRYHGRMLMAAERLNLRLWNLKRNESRGWLSVSGNYGSTEDHYYFRSMVYRFVSLLNVIYLFQNEALYIDSRIAEGNELTFLKFAKSFEWVLTDSALFDGLDYDDTHQRDHFFTDNLRLICDSCTTDGDVMSLSEFQTRISNCKGEDPLRQLLDFFDGLCVDEKRLRWDRTVAFHLLIMAFINTFGYDMQKSTAQQFTDIAKSAKHQNVLNNLNTWLGKLGLENEKEVDHIYTAVRAILPST